MKSSLLLLALFASLLFAQLARADWSADVDFGFMRDDNVTRAQLPADVKSDNASTLSLSGSYSFLLTDHTRIALTADLQEQNFGRYTGLSNLQSSLSISQKTKLGLGLYAPWLRSSVAVTRLDYHDDLRDGWRYTAGVGAGKRLSERWDLQAGYLVERRTADQENPQIAGRNGDVFDNWNRSASVQATFLQSDRILLSFGYARRQGDIVSSTLRNRQIFSVTNALAADRTFGASVVAYKLDATTHSFSAGLSYALGPRSSLNVGAERYLSYAAGDLSYYGNIVHTAFMYSF